MKHLHLENIFRSHFDQQATAVVLYMELKYLTTKTPSVWNGVIQGHKLGLILGHRLSIPNAPNC